MALLNESFDDLSLFYENDSTVIYQGVNKEDGKKVFLKSHKSQDEMFRIKHEFDLLSGKNIPGVTNVLDISYNDDKNYLVLEDTGAVVLDDYIAKHDIDTKTFLQIAQSAAQALSGIHKQGIVHCDIKPANILIHPETLQIWYIDFGISFSLHQRDGGLQGFAGTLEFMAPEQTGRLDMTVDARSDLYSLGITLYFMLTKNLPFTGETAVELIHAQTVLPPAPISEYVAADATVSAIIMKLMEKAPRKRYQSADSLAYDLDLCRKRLDSDGAVRKFTLGELDVFSSLEPGKKLFGKESILDEMKNTFHSTPRNESSLILLHGPGESGKTSVLANFEQYVEQNHGYLLKGSFDWKEDQESFSAIQQLFEGFELYAYNANLPLPEYGKKIQEALGENTQVLLDIVPSFESVLGKQPPAKKLGAMQAQERARQVFTKTFEILCDAPYPYVFIFENVQWADTNSVNLLLSAIEGHDVGNCIMVFSYRDDDLNFLKDFLPRVQTLNRQTLTVSDLGVSHLAQEDIADLINELFDQDSMQTRELANVIHRATGGVVSKVRLFLQNMYRSDQIIYDAQSDSWSVRLDNLDKEILLDMEKHYRQVLEELPETHREIAAKLACMGENFFLADVADAFGLEEPELERVAEHLTELNWLSPDSKNPGRYSFAHQAVFEMCYASQTEEEKNQNHLRVVNSLYEKYKDSDEEMLAHTTLFTRQILSSDRSKFQSDMVRAITGYKLTAARQIMEAANAGQAARTFANGIRLLGEDPFAEDYKLAYHLHLDYAMCCFAMHDEEKATELIEIVLEHADNEDDKYNAYYKIVTQYLSMAGWEHAKIYCKRYLADTGLLVPPDKDPLQEGDKEYARFLELTGDEGIMITIRYGRTKDSLTEHHGNMLALLADALYFSLDEKCKYYLYKAINFAVERGEIYSEFIRNFCVGAARYASVRDFPKAKWLIEKGLEYAEKNGTGQAFLWCIYGNMISHWVNPLAETVEIYKKAKYHSLVEGNAFYEAFADMMLLNYHSFVGENLEEYHRETQATLHNLERNQVTALQANFVTFRQYARCLLDRTAGPDSFDDAQFQEESLEELRGTWDGTFNENFFLVYRMRSLYIHHFYEKAVEYAQKFIAFSQQYNMSAYITQVQFYYYYSLALIELCHKYPEKQEEYLEIIRDNQSNMEFYAGANPANFEHKYSLVETGIKVIYAQDIGLVDEFAEAHSNFIANGMLWDATFVERMIGGFWEKRGVTQYVIIHKKNALRHYKTIGAKYLIDSLAEVDEEARHRRSRRGRTMHTAHSTMHTMHTMHSTNLSQAFMSHHPSRMGATEQTMYTGINAALDFQVLMNVLEDLILAETLPTRTSELMKQLQRNGNAEKALLFLEDGSAMNLTAAKFAVDANSDFNEAELPLNIDVVADGVLPKRLIAKVVDKQETLVANSARNEYKAMGDEYLNKANPESFLCMPVMAKEKLLGVIYLENASLAGAFPEGRVRLLEAIVKQAAVLIQNLQNAAVMENYAKDLERRLSSYLGQQNALIAGIAHEINSPVGVVLTVSTKMFEKTKQVIEALGKKALSKSALDKFLEEARDGLNIINNNIVRAGDLVQNFKQMSVEQSTGVFENLELAPTLRNIVEYIRPGVKKKIDKVEINVPEDLWIYTSSGVLAQIFTNLIMNSAIHGFENIEKDKCHASITVTDLEERGEIEIVYKDNGKGMTEEEHEKVFQPFFTTKRNRGGSGLGGHIILSNVTQTLGGSIRCISAPGEGTTFVMRLPKQKREETTKEAADNA